MGDRWRQDARRSSGGAWLLKGSNTVVGINSYGPVDEKLAYMGSPILNAEFDSLYQYVTTLFVIKRGAFEIWMTFVT